CLIACMMAGSVVTVIDLAFGGDMISFIEAGSPLGTTIPVPGMVRLVAPLRPPALRDSRALEAHMKSALTRLVRPLPDEWYDVPAYYKGMPDTVIGPEDEIP